MGEDTPCSISRVQMGNAQGACKCPSAYRTSAKTMEVVGRAKLEPNWKSGQLHQWSSRPRSLGMSADGLRWNLVKMNRLR